MSATLDQIMSHGRENLPDNVGQAYDKGVKLGSWVTAGIEAYKTGVQEWNALSRYLKRWNNLSEDPTVLFYTLNSILRENPVKIPDYMSGEDYNMIRNLAKKIFGSSNTKTGPFMLNEAGYSPSLPYNDNEKPYEVNSEGVMEETNNDFYADAANYIPGGLTRKSDGSTSQATFNSFNSRVMLNYMDQANPYMKMNNYTTPEGVIEELNQLGYGIGYNYVQGYELGTYDLWNVQLYPYRANPFPEGFKNTWTVDIPAGRYSLVPDFPYYSLPKSNGGYQTYYLGMYLPVISWNLNYGTLGSQNIELFNNSQMQFISGFNYTITIQLSVVDDVYHSFEKYMMKYVNSIYNIKSGLMAPYWASAFIIQLTTFRPGYQINSCHRFIAVPVNWAPSIDGDVNSDESKVTVDYSVIGLIQYSNTGDKIFPLGLGTKSNLNEWTWDQVTLRENPK